MLNRKLCLKLPRKVNKMVKIKQIYELQSMSLENYYDSLTELDNNTDSTTIFLTQTSEERRLVYVNNRRIVK